MQVPPGSENGDLLPKVLSQALLCQAASASLMEAVLELLTQEEVKDRREGEFTARQEQILRLLALEGLSNREIGARLGISESTVKTHIRSILSRLGATDRIDAVAKAFGDELIPLHRKPPDRD